MLLFPLAIIPSVLYSTLPGKNKSAILTDILALSFSHNALSILKLDSFQTGVILLSGLFVYDIWWVFGTEVVRIIIICKKENFSHFVFKNVTIFVYTDGQSCDVS